MTVGLRELGPDELVDVSTLGEFIRSGNVRPVSIRKENTDGGGQCRLENVRDAALLNP
jgi:hypothetical protein